MPLRARRNPELRDFSRDLIRLRREAAYGGLFPELDWVDDDSRAAARRIGLYELVVNGVAVRRTPLSRPKNAFY